ncbi:MAG: hypothetical protein KF773_04620 [Deltaproteobacteria bacterium]|nr:hypothetical protein [Deltaproteobacteria bacterium]
MSTAGGRYQCYRAIVGRELEESERGSIETVNDVTEEVLGVMRAMWKLDRNATVSFVYFIVEAIGLGDATSFVEDVVVGGRDAATWRVADWVVSPRYAMPPAEVTTPFFDSFEGIEGERWYRVTADDDRGVVGVLRRNAKYARPARLDYRSVRACEYVDPSRVLIAHRRWLARRLGGWARADVLAPGATIDSVLAKVPGLVDVANVTDDARIAAAALIREAALDAPTFVRDRGFLGPDGWYGG